MPTVFMDRDGVINRNIENGYVTSWDQFVWLPGAVESIAFLYKQSWNIFITTNQACIGKGIVDQREISGIHNCMQDELRRSGSKITQFYVCPHTSEMKCNCRKPKPGMLLEAKEEHSLDLSSCYFIGDSINDMIAANSVGCTTVLVRTGLGKSHEKNIRLLQLADYYCNNITEAVHIIIWKESVSSGESLH
ncbi:hypothetical protein A8L34_09540 [Bacillus sp. FJAT-27264]|uniref:D-glycero-alpha-D-manno-heptose-1,7-bisphosphate 7-phosphatase n=1 Tax=Paenibacillus sp. (strain DSM 101736 / FJAT-27264) TaxID=1850362 RepID=UPI000807A707|nr:HAD family hydrolase [Bacillus sp. FJAT-27264]OBZ14193.1 hypothetical protein A8L34_09540 [Bacillus sp. FJAT-27264]